MRLFQCPAGYTMIRDDKFPDADECVQCGVNEYLLSPITIQNKSIKCLKCPVGGVCPGLYLVYLMETVNITFCNKL